jgi:AraC-like DNA-binding protein
MIRGSAEPCFSIRLVRPFLKQVGEPAAALAAPWAFASLPPDARIPVSVALSWLECVVASLRDPDLGLRASRHMERGGYDLVEYAARSCETWGDALRVVLRYGHLLNEAADYALHVVGGSARLELRSTLPLDRASSDFTVCAFASAASRWAGVSSFAGFEFWFRHPEPRCTRLYAQTFGAARLRFDAPLEAMVFDAALLTADRNLNVMLRRHADQVLSSLPKRHSVASRVRSILIQLLPTGAAQCECVAEQLEMSRRTLSRHLAEESTSYEALLDEVRLGLALQCLTNSDFTVQDIAFLLGYSETAAFSRAFKRWTGQSPGQYRKGGADAAVGVVSEATG